MQAWLERTDAGAALAVVFLPMLSGDGRASAVREAALLGDPRVSCFWDPGRVSGTVWTAEYQLALLPELLEGLGADDPLAPYVQRWMESGRPVWDVAYFFDGAAGWPAEGLPVPTAWTKQVQFGLDESGQGAGNFWRSRSTWALEWSAWSEEFAAGMAAIAQ